MSVSWALSLHSSIPTRCARFPNLICDNATYRSFSANSFSNFVMFLVRSFTLNERKKKLWNYFSQLFNPPDWPCHNAIPLTLFWHIASPPFDCEIARLLDWIGSKYLQQLAWKEFQHTSAVTCSIWFPACTILCFSLSRESTREPLSCYEKLMKIFQQKIYFRENVLEGKSFMVEDATKLS